MLYPDTGSVEDDGALQVRSTAYVVLCPVPLSAIVAVPPVLALLTSVTVPVFAPVVVGSNPTFSVADCPGFSVAGKLRPETLNPVPATEPELIVSAAVPVDLIRTDCVDVVFRFTLPNATLVLPIDHAALPAFSWMEVALVTPLALAVIVAVCVVLTAEAVAPNDALTAPAGIVSEAGTVSAVLLLASATANPPLGAAAVRLTEHASDAAPVSDPLLHEIALRAAAGAAGFSCKLKLELLFHPFACRVAVCADETAETLAAKVVLFAPLGTVTDAGTCTAALLLVRFTVLPEPLVTVLFRTTVQVSVPAPV